LKNTIEKHG